MVGLNDAIGFPFQRIRSLYDVIEYAFMVFGWKSFYAPLYIRRDEFKQGQIDLFTMPSFLEDPPVQTDHLHDDAGVWRQWVILGCRNKHDEKFINSLTQP